MNGKHITASQERESVVVKEIKDLLSVLGLAIQRINTGCFKVGSGSHTRYIRTCQKGTLDFEGYDNHGRFVGIECKRPSGGRVSPEQQARIDDINAKGGLAFVARSGAEALSFLQANNCL